MKLSKEDNNFCNAAEYEFHKYSESGELLRMMNILQSSCHGRALASGWHHDLDTGERKADTIDLALANICKMHGELSEAQEGVRKGIMDQHLTHRPNSEVEYADTIIRIFDEAGRSGLDVVGAILEKMAYNMIRSDHKISSRQESGGKKS